MKIRIGTRGSHLARTQSTMVANDIEKLGHETELVVIKTSGDQSDASSFGAIGPQGVFVREIEQALLDDEIDVAVHSYKDLPTQSPGKLMVGAVPPRLDASDVLILRKEVATGNDRGLPIAPGAKIGTASARRQAWIKHLRPDLTVEPIRGNVPTRIGKLNEGYDGIVLAAAGLERLQASPIKDAALELEHLVVEPIMTDVFVPAPAQGALAIQCRLGDAEMRDTLAPLDDADTRRCIYAERTLLARVEGGCDLAFGAYARPGDSFEGEFRLVAMLEHDGKVVTSKARGADPLALVETVWQALEKKIR